MLPARRDDTISSSFRDAVSGSAKRSPVTMARENEFFACNLESFSNTRES